MCPGPVPSSCAQLAVTSAIVIVGCQSRSGCARGAGGPAPSRHGAACHRPLEISHRLQRARRLRLDVPHVRRPRQPNAQFPRTAVSRAPPWLPRVRVRRAQASKAHAAEDLVDEPIDPYEGNVIVPGNEWEPVRVCTPTPTACPRRSLQPMQSGLPAGRAPHVASTGCACLLKPYLCCSCVFLASSVPAVLPA